MRERRRSSQEFACGSVVSASNYSDCYDDTRAKRRPTFAVSAMADSCGSFLPDLSFPTAAQELIRPQLWKNSPALETLFDKHLRYHAADCWRPVVSIDTTTSVRNPRGIVRMPGWLNGTIAAAASRP